MPIVDTRTLPSREPKAGWHGRFFHSALMSFAYCAIARGERHHTTFCRVLDPARGPVRPAQPDHDYGD